MLLKVTENKLIENFAEIWLMTTEKRNSITGY